MKRLIANGLLTGLIFMGSLGDFAARAADSPAPLVLRVACAADLESAMGELQKSFEKANPGVELKISVGASGTLASQIEQQAPFDLFFSADTGYPDHLAKKGLAQGDPFEYAQGKLELWISRSLKLSADPKTAKLQILEDPAIHKIAIGNPEHAPYGRAAVAALKSEKVYEAVQAKLVRGENIAQAAQFIQTGAADAGLISVGLAQSPALQKLGTAIDVSAADYPPLRQSALILRNSPHPDLASRFRTFVVSDQGQLILKKYGYTTTATATGN